MHYAASTGILRPAARFTFISRRARHFQHFSIFTLFTRRRYESRAVRRR